MLARRRSVAGYGREIGRPRLRRQGAGMLILRKRAFQALVGGGGLILECIKLRIVKNFPPCAALDDIDRLRLCPVPQFLIGGGSGCFRHFVIRRQRASGKGQNGGNKQNLFHGLLSPLPPRVPASLSFASFLAFGAATLTDCPVAKESGGLTMIVSPGETPAVT